MRTDERILTIHWLCWKTALTVITLSTL